MGTDGKVWDISRLESLLGNLGGGGAGHKLLHADGAHIETTEGEAEVYRAAQS